jgi:hypothetical protein
MAKASKKLSPATPAAARGGNRRGRPPTNVEWKAIGVRFLPEEKDMIAEVASKAGVSQADIIRQGAVLYARKALESGSLVIKV